MNNIKIAIIGLGYVGLPLAIELSKYYRVIGYDHFAKRIKTLKNFKDNNNQFNKTDLKKSKIEFTKNEKDLKKANIYIICVPTPVDFRKKPDLKHLKDASKLVSKNLTNSDIVIYESTVYPGTTENVCQPILEKYSKLKCNKDFFLGYSPERINPGDKKHTLPNIKKVVSANNKNTLQKIYSIYSKIIKAGVYKAENIKTAEAAKIIENTQRDINIAFINELSIIFEKMSINTNEVIKAASTKWNFIKFKPGLVGGHCIGVDPYYLAHASKKHGYNSNFILSGRSINENAYKRVLEKIKIFISNLNSKRKINTLVLGLAFKEDCPDIRNSQAIKIVENLMKIKNFKISLFDPVINKEDLNQKFKSRIIDTFNKQKYDIVLYLVPHKKIKDLTFNKIKQKLKKGSLVIDIHNIIQYKKIENITKNYYTF